MMRPADNSLEVTPPAPTNQTRACCRAAASLAEAHVPALGKTARSTPGPARQICRRVSAYKRPESNDYWRPCRHRAQLAGFARIFADLTAECSRGRLPLSVTVLPRAGAHAAAFGAGGQEAPREQNQVGAKDFFLA